MILRSFVKINLLFGIMDSPKCKSPYRTDTQKNRHNRNKDTSQCHLIIFADNILLSPALLQIVFIINLKEMRVKMSLNHSPELKGFIVKIVFMYVIEIMNNRAVTDNCIDRVVSHI